MLLLLHWQSARCDLIHFHPHTGCWQGVLNGYTSIGKVLSWPHKCFPCAEPINKVCDITELTPTWQRPSHFQSARAPSINPVPNCNLSLVQAWLRLSEPYLKLSSFVQQGDVFSYIKKNSLLWGNLRWDHTWEQASALKHYSNDSGLLVAETQPFSTLRGCLHKLHTLQASLRVPYGNGEATAPALCPLSLDTSKWDFKSVTERRA